MKIKGRHKRCIELARKVAETSLFRSFRHGAILIRSGSFLSAAPNEIGFSHLGARFRNTPSNARMHAEINCVTGLPRSMTVGATMYVVRIGRDGKFRLSKPCDMCIAVLKFVGVKRVFYSIDEETMGEIRL